MSDLYPGKQLKATNQRKPHDYAGQLVIRPYGLTNFGADTDFTIGIGAAIGHHGELIQGAVEHPKAGLRYFLVTLPWPNIKSHAKFVPVRNGDLLVEPVWKTKSSKAVGLTLAYLGFNGYGGFLQVHSEAPPRLGLGSSTSDVVATIRAVANAFNRTLNPSEISSIAVESEFACDSIMFEEQAVVYCQREGIVMESLSNALPPAFILGFNASDTNSGVSTLDYPLPNYNRQELEAFRSLFGELRLAANERSIQLLGKVATASARINQRFLPKPNFNALLEILNKTGACGIQIAHSGNVAGFLFDPDDINLAKRIFRARRELVKLGIKHIWNFNTARKTQ